MRSDVILLISLSFNQLHLYHYCEAMDDKATAGNTDVCVLIKSDNPCPLSSPSRNQGITPVNNVIIII